MVSITQWESGKDSKALLEARCGNLYVYVAGHVH